MSINGDGTARRALITGAIGLAFSGFAWGASSIVSNIISRLAYLEREADRVGKIAAGRGDRIDRLEKRVDSAEDRLHRLELSYSGNPPSRGQRSRTSEW